MISQTDLDKLFSAEKEHGADVAEKFKAFVQSLDEAIPDGVSKTKLINYLHEASGWAHNALNDAEQEARKLAHLRSKTGEKPAAQVAEGQGVAPEPPLPNALDTDPAGDAPKVQPNPTPDAPPAS